MTAFWWVWSTLGLVFGLASIGTFGWELWQLRCALWTELAPYQSRSALLATAGRTLIIAALTAGTGLLCLTVAGVA